MQNPESFKSNMKKPDSLTASFEKRLLSYAVAASAASVGIMANAQAANAEIVFTPSNTKIYSLNRHWLSTSTMTALSITT
jgi:hypothetical protein